MAMIEFRLPRYGDWGGKEWSAGEDVPTGQELTEDQKAVPGIDAMDEVFKEHDLAYEAAWGLSGTVGKLAELQADQDLLDGLDGLDWNDPGTFQDPIIGKNFYRQAYLVQCKI